MLKTLRIKNYAIIDELEINLGNNLNAFIGETGAGKSIIIGALAFLIRGKADSSIIRNGCDKASVEGVFEIKEFMKPILDEAGIDYDDELIVKRIISKDGKNSIKINQESVTLSFLGKIFDEHIDIHSQKNSQFLLNKNNHLLLLDNFANSDSLLKQYKEKYKKYTSLNNELNELLNSSFSEREIELVKYDLEELENAKLSTEEEKDLEEKEKRYKSIEKYLSVLNTVTQIYYGENGGREIIQSAIRELKIDDDKINQIEEKIKENFYNLDDNFSELNNILESLNDGDCDINNVENRLFLYSKLKRKHGKTVEELLDYINELQDKIETFNNREVVIENKKVAIEKAKEEACEIADKLSELRKTKAEELSAEILNQTKDLMLKNVKFVIEMNTKKGELNINGQDSPEFLVSMNLGEDVKPLKDVASGGEISRFMLALKTVFMKLSNTMFAIFDEIDTGVSGKVGLSMGLKMSEISDNVQVITITHLASVAACADDLFFIYKEDKNNITSTNIRKLKSEEIIENLALISSTNNNDSSLLAAKELYHSAQEMVENNRKEKRL